MIFFTEIPKSCFHIDILKLKCSIFGKNPFLEQTGGGRGSTFSSVCLLCTCMCGCIWPTSCGDKTRAICAHGGFHTLVLVVPVFSSGALANRHRERKSNEASASHMAATLVSNTIHGQHVERESLCLTLIRPGSLIPLDESLVEVGDSWVLIA